MRPTTLSLIYFLSTGPETPANSTTNSNIDIKSMPKIDVNLPYNESRKALRNNIQCEYKRFYWIYSNGCLGLYLMWKISISHGDVSHINMMYKEKGEVTGILSGSDRTAEMKNAFLSLGKKGWEQTCTLLFIASDLLKFCEEETKRWYRHDLESITWCLTWLTVSKESELLKWYTGTLKQIYYHKNSVLFNFDVDIVKKDWQAYAIFIIDWLSSWCALHREMSSLTRYTSFKTKTEKFDKREAYDIAHPDEGFIRQVVDIAKGLGLERGRIDALNNTTWINVQL